MKHVALLIETSRSYGRELLEGIHRYVAEHGPWSMYLELRALDSRPPGWLKRWRGDGIITRTGSPETARAIARTGVPAVELRSTRLRHGFPFVGVDNRALGRLVAGHLLERGFRHFGVYALDIEDYFVERRDDFVAAVREAGCDAGAFAAPHGEQPREWERHQDRLVAWIRGLPKPVGLMACTDQLGYWLLDACARAGIAVPEEAAVVGCENDETLCKMAAPPLSSVAYDAHRVGYTAAALLDGLMSGKAAPAHTLIPPLSIVTRRSSDVVAIDDQPLSAAVRYMRAEACRGITVADVLRAAPMSRRTLERKMQALFGRSPREELERVRMETARQLLRDTDLTLDRIAERCGFRSAPHFCTQFRRATGVTPGRYRSQRGGSE